MSGLDSGGSLVENFRDVGAFVGLLARRPILPEGRLLRGGSIRHLASLEAVGNPRTILNLQAVSDPVWANVSELHFPATARDEDVYDTRARDVRSWLRGIVRRLSQGVEVPLYVHCFSGRDRTGVVVAVLLLVLGVSEDVIVAEYELSDGTPGQEPIRAALDGLGDPERYFAGIDPESVRRSLLEGER